MRIEIHSIEYHRNGIGGEGFNVVTFTDHSEGGAHMVGIIFESSLEEEGACNPRCAILDIDLLNSGIIGFGENSWRGDVYFPHLKEAIQAWAARRYGDNQ